MKYLKRSISNPISGLNLQRLSAQIDSFQNGYLSDFALTAEAMENRDDILKNVISKRKKSVTRHGWEILSEDCTAIAREHRAALEFFYRNLICSHALRSDERGNFQLLLYQMMDAVAKGYAVHEIIWKPVLTRKRGNGPSVAALSAELRFVPLWYFESTTGPLRFLSSPGSQVGEEMAERDWLITMGDALMVACSRAFLFKHYPLQAWLDFTEKFGLPGVRGITSAARGTAEFSEMEDALRAFMSNLAVVTNTAESIDVVDLKGSGTAPFAELVERMDRVMCSLWRGADLSTLSRDKGYGATLQEQEARILEQDDARHISEHLNATLDRWVLEQVFGRNTKPLARVKILVTPQERTPHDLAIDQFLLQHGARLPLAQTLERYGRVQANPNEPALELPTPSAKATLNLKSQDVHDTRPESTRLGHANSCKFMNTMIQTPVEELTGTLTPSAQTHSGPDDYVQISPLGVFDHARGFQSVNKATLENLVKNFRSFFRRLGRRFAGIPFYIGHPDVPGFENLYSDRKAYGWIMELEVRDEGLFGKTHWSPAGRELIANRHFKFLSPYWEAIRIGTKDGKGLFAPTVLRSVGLTNEPNLPVMPLANSNGPDDETDASCLGAFVPLFPNDTSQELQLPESDPNSESSKGSASLDQLTTDTLTAVSSNRTSNDDIRKQIANCQNEISVLNQRLIQVVLDNAVIQARILPVERPHWNDALLANFENTAAELANAAPKLNTKPRTESLKHSYPRQSEEKQKRILAMVNDRMRSAGASYHDAWVAVSAENPNLF